MCGICSILYFNDNGADKRSVINEMTKSTYQVNFHFVVDLQKQLLSYCNYYTYNTCKKFPARVDAEFR